jgi:acylphosphatase
MVRATASPLGLTGWVRNEIDGSVLLEAQGEPAAIERLLDMIAQQRGDTITGRSVEPLAVVVGERGFRIILRRRPG